LILEILRGQRRIQNEVQAGKTLHIIEHEPGFSLVCTQFGRDSSTREFHCLLPRIKAIVVGIDIREYSRRQIEQQLFITTNLFIAVKQAIDLLVKAGIISNGEPLITVQTGDGAYVVFSFLNNYSVSGKYKLSTQAIKFLEKLPSRISHEIKIIANQEIIHADEVAGWAFSFILTLNCILKEYNVKQQFKYGCESKNKFYPTFPIECRYAMSYNDVLLMEDLTKEKIADSKVHDNLHCVGNAMITCARILSTDRGNHFLVDTNLLNLLGMTGGLAKLCGGEWGQKLNQSVLEDLNIKGEIFRYANVFGSYNDSFLLNALHRIHLKSESYDIGSHDVNSLKR
jgi:hypothetical protein